MSDEPHYTPRISNVIAHIERHLDDDLSLQTLSQVAACSKYHFHRVFSAETGMNVTQFVRLLRLKRASFRLAFEADKSVLEIAIEAGFETPEAFAKAFRRIFSQSPSEFRCTPQWDHWHQQIGNPPTLVTGAPMDINIVDFPATKVAVLEHHGAPTQILQSVGRFIAWRKATGLSPLQSAMTFGIPYSDPHTTPAEDFRWDVCGSVEQDVPDNDFGVKTGLIPGGRCARVRHQGSHDRLDESIIPVFRDWLPESGQQLRDFPCFFHYLNFIHQVDECDLLTDIYVPLI
ncbi:AraC family transcriptional regulator [Aestuariibacter halophilus]|uniref:AraC family transcriptional regulator n=1 Tax=Fluctibacter halophilus TaxID=226011 RepID=A0ABS8GBB2_9ALTE|nr:AraC family transcriptional regulator [Aestuariibacter halophilus]MCC2617832.1 AraC family transcriptional regulator [Aestuariibacter halophilus]